VKITLQIASYVGRILISTYVQPLMKNVNQQPIFNHQSSMVANSCTF